MQTLKQLCGEGHTVLVSIHQPRSSVFAAFDDLILLAGGWVGGWGLCLSLAAGLCGAGQ